MCDHDGYKKDMKQLYLRKKNTFRYSIKSSDGNTKDNSGEFNFQIPPLNGTNKDSQYCLFRFNSFYTMNEECANAGDRPSNSLQYDIPAFFVEINGLGLSPNNFNTNLNARLRGSNIFFIQNTLGLTNDNGLLGNGDYQVLCGGEYEKSEVVCSNPSGTSINVIVRDALTDAIIPNSVDIVSVLNFEIELLDID
jgi:hypothetical protein